MGNVLKSSPRTNTIKVIIPCDTIVTLENKVDKYIIKEAVKCEIVPDFTVMIGTDIWFTDYVNCDSGVDLTSETTYDSWIKIILPAEVVLMNSEGNYRENFTLNKPITVTPQTIQVRGKIRLTRNNVHMSAKFNHGWHIAFKNDQLPVSATKTVYSDLFY